jgi:hypothetical protein
MQISPQTRDQVLRLRARGWTYEQIGRAAGIHYSTAWNVVRRYGRDPKPDTVRIAHWTMTDAVRQFDEVYIERGAGSGFVCTVGGQYTGHERRSIQGAMKSAIAQALWAEQAIDEQAAGEQEGEYE